jgi:hypothetical protein
LFPRLLDNAQASKQFSHFGRPRLVGDPQQSVNHGVAGDDDALVGDALGQQVSARSLGRRKAEVADMIRHDSIHLFRERVAAVVGTQAGLHVTHLDLPVLRGERRHHHRGRIPLHQHPIRLLGRQNLIHGRQDARAQGRKGLAGLHQVQINVRDDAEGRQSLIEHLTMLRRGAGAGHESIGSRLQSTNDRRHLDSLGPGAEDDQDTLPIVRP